MREPLIVPSFHMMIYILFGTVREFFGNSTAMCDKSEVLPPLGSLFGILLLGFAFHSLFNNTK
jgi:hypothetical protein